MFFFEGFLKFQNVSDLLLKKMVVFSVGIYGIIENNFKVSRHMIVYMTVRFTKTARWNVWKLKNSELEKSKKKNKE